MPLHADTLDVARAEAREHFEHEDNRHHLTPGESELSHAVLVTGSEFLPVDEWKASLTARQARSDAEQRRTADLAELDRLQRLYG